MAKAKSDKNNRRLRQSEQFLRFTGLGFQWLLTFGLMGFLGYELDVWLNTLPLFLVIFLILALVGNIYLVIRITNK